jgi:type VI secretion system protein ImpH
MRIPEQDRTRLGAQNESVMLGIGAALGAHVWDRQHKFRIWLGPLTVAQYEGFLPGGKAISRLVAWVRQYLCFELEWDVRLVLANSEVPKARLGSYGRLGWNTWLGARRSGSDASDLTLDPEGLGTGD